ncbi:MAG: GTPase [Candidatus Binatia bacterium]
MGDDGATARAWDLSMHAGDLQRVLDRLRAQLRDNLARVAGLRAVQERRPEIDRLLDDLDRQLLRVQRAPVITLVGATGAGKSTLLNALAGRAVAIEGIDRPTTRRAVIYAPHDADLGELTSAERPEAGDAQSAPHVVRYAPGDGAWTAQVLIDAPDTNSIDEQHRAMVSTLAERSDVLVVVLHHQSVLEAESIAFVDEFAGRRQLLFVLNRADELTADARRALLMQVRELAAARWGAAAAPVIALSARAAQAQPNAEGWAEFCRAVSDLARDGTVMAVRRLNALGTAARLAGLFGEVRAATAEDLAALPLDAAAGFDRLGERIAAEVAERLALRRADLRELLWGEAARRWDGPGGWALRTGGLSAVGLGAGAAIATRHPLLAAGTAAGALAADQVQRVLREQRLGNAAALMPATPEFEAWFSEALSPARLRAARLTGAPDALALPSVDAARAAAGAAVEDAWARLLSRDLPAAAERSALRYVRWLLDLPVYALLGWVLWKVGRGLLSGEYAGVDFLLGAAVVAAAYLFAVRFAVRRGLGWRAGRLLGEVILRARQALGALADQGRENVRRAVSAQAAAIGALAALDGTWQSELESPTHVQRTDAEPRRRFPT